MSFTFGTDCGAREGLFLSHEGAETECPGSDVSARSGAVLILSVVVRIQENQTR